ncbi:MAG: hypothetical protein LBS85_03835, partial [Clostridiales Family XIII bacterium]|nr:hypothetical protein [Clostridiales Family XIII bacterium]
MSNIAFVNTPSARFAVIGDPVSHSLSPLLHKTAFEIMGSGAVYTQLRVEAKDLERFARLMRG